MFQSEETIGTKALRQERVWYVGGTAVSPVQTEQSEQGTERYEPSMNRARRPHKDVHYKLNENC